MNAPVMVELEGETDPLKGNTVEITNFHFEEGYLISKPNKCIYFHGNRYLDHVN